MKKIPSNIQISSVWLDEDSKNEKVFISFTEAHLRDTNMTVEDAAVLNEVKGDLEEESEEDDEPMFYINGTDKKGQFPPHADFVAAMAKLTKFALEICEIDGSRAGWSVRSFKIAGNVLEKKSRIVFELAKYVKRSKKSIAVNTPQITMYGETEYERAKDMSSAVEEVITEAWGYLLGKYGEDAKGQLPLFEVPMKVSKRSKRENAEVA